MCNPYQESPLVGPSWFSVLVMSDGRQVSSFSDFVLGCIFYIWTGALQIEQSEESDQGKYECVATNSAGTRYSAPANLYVRGRNDKPLVSPFCKHWGFYFQDVHSHCHDNKKVKSKSMNIHEKKMYRFLPMGCKYIYTKTVVFCLYMCVLLYFFGVFYSYFMYWQHS